MQKIIHRLAIIEGHVRGINQMVQTNQSCPDVLMQLMAVRSALIKVAQIILEDHASHCLTDASQGSSFEAELANLFSALDLLI